MTPADLNFSESPYGLGESPYTVQDFYACALVEGEPFAAALPQALCDEVLNSLVVVRHPIGMIRAYRFLCHIIISRHGQITRQAGFLSQIALMMMLRGYQDLVVCEHQARERSTRSDEGKTQEFLKLVDWFCNEARVNADAAALQKSRGEQDRQRSAERLRLAPDVASARHGAYVKTMVQAAEFELVG